MMATYTQHDLGDVKLQRSLTLPNDVETIPQLNEFIDTIAETIGLDMSLTMSLNLAIEEAVVNVMDYAYPQGVKGDVTIDVAASDQWLQFIISDSGTPFDPTKKEEADTTLSVDERPIGGLGIFLVRQLMDTIQYDYVDGKNVLTLRKQLTTQTS
ncbi:Anti-sigma regulatory factor (Ser/Thr protein kinase) [Prevotellaceae bacterium HUN156]|jgi:sigma-B regulation protein RsbU (phosphoserine phosphatase)|nr:Anti-sigma regulatory factor (Ser/Thr protein kinase) [Prevotellaceae bacterium HUN156]